MSLAKNPIANINRLMHVVGINVAILAWPLLVSLVPTPASASECSIDGDVVATVTFSKVLNRTKRGRTGNMEAQSVFGDGSVAASGQPFTVVAGGVPVTNRVSNTNQRGLSVDLRGDGSLELVHHGYHPYTDFVYEVAYWQITFNGARIANARMSASPNGLEHQGDGVHRDLPGTTYDGIGYGHNDEFTVSADRQSLSGYFGVGNYGDGVVIDLLPIERCVFPSVSVSPTPSASPIPTVVPDVIQSKGLTVEKTDSRDITRPGHTLTYVINVTNTGEVDLDDVKVTETIPSALTIITAEGSNRDGNQLVWSNIALSAGQRKTFTIVAKVKDSVASGYVIRNTVVVTSNKHGLSDEDTDLTINERKPAVAAKVVKVVPIAVPVTAKTGAGMLGLAVTTLLSGSSLAYFIKRKLS